MTWGGQQSHFWKAVLALGASPYGVFTLKAEADLTPGSLSSSRSKFPPQDPFFSSAAYSQTTEQNAAGPLDRHCIGGFQMEEMMEPTLQYRGHSAGVFPGSSLFLELHVPLPGSCYC